MWLILRSLQKLGPSIETKELLAYAGKTSLRSGWLPVDDGFALARRGRFIREASGEVTLAPLGLEALQLCAEDEPSRDVRRLFTSVLLLQDPPPWVAYWQGDPATLEMVIPTSDREVLKGAGLYPLREDAALPQRAWWRALSVVPVPEAVAAQRKLIGDAGETLSLAFERARLQSEGFPELARRVWWAAQESAAYGFDVASFCGSIKPENPDHPLGVEVKSVAYPVRERFPFHLTIHEWATATEMSGYYLFHFWSGVRPGDPTTASNSSPLIYDPGSLISHLATSPSCKERCKWESVYIEMPLETTKGRR